MREPTVREQEQAVSTLLYNPRKRTVERVPLRTEEPLPKLDEKAVEYAREALSELAERGGGR
jgi:hypothetical protein